MEWKKQYRAVLIETPPNEPHRLFSAGDGYPRLWDMTNQKAQNDIMFMLIDNGIKASPVTVEVSVVA